MALDDEKQGSTSEVEEQAQWLLAIERDFSPIGVAAFNKQRKLVSGTPSAKAYYKSVLQSFKTKTSNFIAFSTKYHDETAKPRQPNRLLREAKPYFDKVHALVNSQEPSSVEAKLERIRAFYKVYYELLQFLAVQKLIYTYEHQALWYAIEHGFTDIAIDLINTPGINLNFYHLPSAEKIREYALTTVLLRAAYMGNEVVTRALCEASGIDLHIKDVDGKTALEWTSKKEIEIMLMYYMLKAATPDAALRILFIRSSFRLVKEDIYQYILSLVNETTDDNVKVNILANAIAKDEGGQPVSALSYYLQNIKSPYNDVVKKIQDRIEEIRAQTNSRIEIVIERPTVTLESINNRPEDRYIKTEVLAKIRKEIASRGASDLELDEERYAENKDLIPFEETTEYLLQQAQIVFSAAEAYLRTNNDASANNASSSSTSGTQGSNSRLLSDTASSTSNTTDETRLSFYQRCKAILLNFISSKYTRNSLIGSLVTGIVVGLVLDFGFNSSITTVVVTAAVSAVTVFVLVMAGFFGAKQSGTGQELEPLSYTLIPPLGLMTGSDIVYDNTNALQSRQAQVLVSQQQQQTPRAVL